MLILTMILLGALALLFACWPLLRPTAGSGHVTDDQQGLVKAVYRQRMQEIAAETPDAELRGELEDEMGAVLLAEADNAEAPAHEISASRGGSRRWFIPMFAIPLLGAGLYLLVADPGAQSIRGAEAVLELSADSSQAKLQDWSERLQQRVQRKPQDSRSWYLLGHARLKLQQFQEAARAFARASALLGGEDVTVDVYWLQARYLAANGVLDDTSQAIARKLLQADPGLTPVLELLAMESFRQGDAAQAVSYLSRALAGTRNPTQQATFASAITQVRASMQEPPPGISVQVAAQDAAPANATVFALARPVGGGMPYAVARRPAFLLPFEVRLDDLVSMSPERLLTDAETFEVVVRLSTSGAPMAQPDDWQWVSEPMNLADGESRTLDVSLRPPEA